MILHREMDYRNGDKENQDTQEEHGTHSPRSEIRAAEIADIFPEDPEDQDAQPRGDSQADDDDEQESAHDRAPPLASSQAFVIGYVTAVLDLRVIDRITEI